MQTLDGDATQVSETSPPSRNELVAAIQCADDTPWVREHVPEWELNVWIRTLSATEGADLAGQVLALGEDAADGAVRMLVLYATLCDEEGNRLFLDLQEAGRVLGARSNQVVTRLFNRAQELNGFGREEMEQAEGN